MNFFDSAVKFLQDGGDFIYIIGAVLIVGLAIAIERWLYLSATFNKNKRALNELRPALKVGDLDKIKQSVENSNAPVSEVLQAGTARMSTQCRREDIEYAMEETIMEYMLKLETRTPLLATLANIATLLGLLGTIMGLISAFAVVAEANPAEKATLLSNSISIAMNTTAFGLITAIPLILIHTGLQSKTAAIVDSLEMVGIKLLNSFSSQQERNNSVRD